MTPRNHPIDLQPTKVLPKVEIQINSPPIIPYPQSIYKICVKYLASIRPLDRHSILNPLVFKHGSKMIKNKSWRNPATSSGRLLMGEPCSGLNSKSLLLKAITTKTFQTLPIILKVGIGKPLFRTSRILASLQQ